MDRMDCMDVMDVINAIKTRGFQFALKSEVAKFQRVSDLPISGLIFEERVDRALTAMGIETDWTPTGNSHKSGADILGLSLKTNKVRPLRGTLHTGMTSYRTATFSEWEDKKAFIKAQDAMVKGYLFLSRHQTKDSTNHYLYLIEKGQDSFLDIDSYTVSGTDGNFAGVSASGISFQLRKSTSGQLIFQNIPLTSLEKYLVMKF